MKDFSSSNQRGRNFNGQDLRGANFSNADIRGANFSRADLRGTDFTRAEAGLQKRWFAIQHMIALIMSVVTGVMQGYTGNVLAYYFPHFDNVESFTLLGFTVIIAYFATIITTFTAIARQGFTVKTLSSIATTGIGVVAIAVIALFNNALAVSGSVTVAVAGIVVVTVVIGVTVYSSISGTGFSIICGVVTTITAAVFALIFSATTRSSGSNDRELVIIIATVAAIATSITCLLFGVYCNRRVLKNDEKFSLIRIFRSVFLSIGGTRFYKADLTGVDFTNAILKSTNFREATLTHVCWEKAQKLDSARVGDSILQNSAVRELLVTRNGYKKSYVSADLEGANLQGVNLDTANLTRANLSHALLRRAYLKDANLRETLVVGADFTRAYFTGACLEAWNIDHTTKLDQIVCQYVFLLNQQDEKGNRERRPHNPDVVFAPGDFEKLYKRIINTVQILMRDGINREAFAAAFQKLMQDNLDITLDSIQGIEKKGSDILLTIKVPQSANKAEIAQSFETTYRDRVRQLEAENEQLKLRSIDLKDIAIELARRPTQVTNQLTAGDQTVNDNTQRNQIVSIGGNVIGSTINLGKINGAVSNAINQLPSTAAATQPGIKEYLLELQATIKAEPTLLIEDKADALEGVKTLAEVAQDPQQPDKQSLARKAIKLLKGTVSALPDTAKLVEACRTLLPLIAKAIGLPVP